MFSMKIQVCGNCGYLKVKVKSVIRILKIIFYLNSLDYSQIGLSYFYTNVIHAFHGIQDGFKS